MRKEFRTFLVTNKFHLQFPLFPHFLNAEKPVDVEGERKTKMYLINNQYILILTILLHTYIHNEHGRSIFG